MAMSTLLSGVRKWNPTRQIGPTSEECCGGVSRSVFNPPQHLRCFAVRVKTDKRKTRSISKDRVYPILPSPDSSRLCRRPFAFEPLFGLKNSFRKSSHFLSGFLLILDAFWELKSVIFRSCFGVVFLLILGLAFERFSGPFWVPFWGSILAESGKGRKPKSLLFHWENKVFAFPDLTFASPSRYK